jgi:hypothetical protein
MKKHPVIVPALTLRVIRQSAIDSAGDELTALEAQEIIDAVNRQIAVGADPDAPIRGPIIDLSGDPRRGAE